MEDNTSSQQRDDNHLPNQPPNKQNVPQQPPAKQLQNQDAFQKLVLPGQQLPVSSFHSDETQIIGPILSSPPPPYQLPGHASSSPSSSPAKKWKLSAMVAWTLVAVLALTLFFFVVQSAIGALGAPQGQPTASPTTALTPSPTATPVQNVSTITITPSNIQVTRDCQNDDGFRCTLTLKATQGQDSASWQAETQDLKTHFHPRAGTLQPGQQQQIILYIENRCPFTGQIRFTGGHLMTSVSLHC
ncbi:MAG TPA: hypothetical protein VH593_17745 [Ktedonobacteraceae bacterium]|jgi:hypothetical protein